MGRGGLDGEPPEARYLRAPVGAWSPSSILTGRNGTSTSVVVRMTQNGSTESMTVYDATNTTQLPLGTITGGNLVTADATFGASGTASTMVMSGSQVTITLGTASSGPRTSSAATMFWTPSVGLLDAGDNDPMTLLPALESRSSDADF